MKHCRIQKGHLCETKTEEFVFCEREAGYFMYMTNLRGMDTNYFFFFWANILVNNRDSNPPIYFSSEHFVSGRY